VGVEMNEGLRQAVYPRVKAASGAFGALHREADRLLEQDEVEDAAALLEMVLVRELDDWYWGDTEPNLRSAITRLADSLTKGGEVAPDLVRCAGLLAFTYARLPYDTAYSHELCKTVFEKRLGALDRPERRRTLQESVAEWDESRRAEPLGDVLARADLNELRDLGEVLGIDRKLLSVKRKDIAKKLESELMYAGADSIVSVFRGRGVPYDEIARDVADRQGIQVNRYEGSAAPVIERRIVLKLIEESWDGLAPKARAEVVAAARKAGVEGVEMNHTGKAMAFALLAAGRMSGFFAYQLAVVVANAVSRAILGHGLSFAANAGLTRGLSVALGPVGWGANVLTSIPAISGPAYRKTIPAVIHVGMMRSRQRAGLTGEG